MLTVGAQVSSLKPYLQTPEDVRLTFQKLSEMGYRVVQLQWISPEVSPEFIAGALRETGLTSVSTQDFYEAVVSDLDRFLLLNDLCGSKLVCVSGIPDQFLSAEGCKRFAGELALLADRLEREGKILVFHPRAQEYASFNGKAAVDILMENTPETFFLGLDLYHVDKAGLAPEDWIRRYASRLSFVHFKDHIVRDGKETLVPVGQGEIHWDLAVQACREVGVEWVFAEQERWEKDAFLCMRESLEYLKGQGFQP